MGLFDFSRFFLAPDSDRIPNGTCAGTSMNERPGGSNAANSQPGSDASAGTSDAVIASICPEGANRFVVAPGHVVTEFEAVVKEYPHFWLVEKRGKAGDEAEALA